MSSAPHFTVKQILNATDIPFPAVVKGWVRTFRQNQFIALNDGTTVQPLQIVVDSSAIDDQTLKNITPGAALEAHGTIVESPGKGQRVEMQAQHIIVHGPADPNSYPLQPKKHSLEFLRSIAHLRFKTNTFGAVFRLRHGLAIAIHEFFHSKDFYYLHSPIITASDCEGAGEMFRVTTLDPKNPPLKEDGSVDWSKDFFGREAHLTVSGQLEAELAAMGLTRVYTFGPTFRAEKSHTTRHLAEFWMVEPEVAFARLDDIMDLAEELLKHLIQYSLQHYPDELAFLQKRLEDEEKQLPKEKRSPMPLIEKLQFVLSEPFQRISYTEAFDILKASKPNRKKKFKYPLTDWGIDFQTEHERYLVEKHFKKPVIIYNYPAEIKAFYMYLNDDGKTVRGMDVLFPGIGEIIGGSERETRIEVLKKRMTQIGIAPDEMQWYLDIRRWGGCPHAGFGLGFDRLVQFVTGMQNIRDAIPFPRYPGYVAY